MLLIIDTTQYDNFYIGLSDIKGKIKFRKIVHGQLMQSEKILPSIDSFLRGKGVLCSSLKGIVVVTGPGNFTSVRVGVVTANTFSFALNVPIVGISRSEFESAEKLAVLGAQRLKIGKRWTLAKPVYNAEPNITKSKKQVFH
ncbi:MAG: tRNA (adenosine(37)-N6)-threonylcarbamoyltransferase complex dimerization subunit type 1 TsaB [Patescibacteria group bacterium]|jgi:tRNA threonylcarbamoyl adenosine modification protein YeaZ